jgi:hypothetical protein
MTSWNFNHPISHYVFFLDPYLVSSNFLWRLKFLCWVLGTTNQHFFIRIWNPLTLSIKNHLQLSSIVNESYDTLYSVSCFLNNSKTKRLAKPMVKAFRGPLQHQNHVYLKIILRAVVEKKLTRVLNFQPECVQMFPKCISNCFQANNFNFLPIFFVWSWVHMADFDWISLDFHKFFETKLIKTYNVW